MIWHDYFFIDEENIFMLLVEVLKLYNIFRVIIPKSSMYFKNYYLIGHCEWAPEKEFVDRK